MIELKSVEFKNFLSYGDYVTKIDLDSLGQCLILGEIADNEDVDRGEEYAKYNKSNGSGKSSIISAIQYGLFGRTMHNANPGDKIINWFTGKDCFVRLTMKNGDSITRLRNSDGINEVIYTKDGDQDKLVSNTLSTAAAQQAKLNKIFNLDWDIFCGSVFFTQYGKPWLEMADAVRKKAIERILHIDRFTYYSKVAKEKSESIDRVSANRRNRIEQINLSIERTTKHIELTKSAIDNYTTNKSERIKHLQTLIANESARRDQLKLPDLDTLSKKWDIIKEAKKLVEKYEDQILGFTRQLSTKQGLLSSYNQRIKNWEAKNGKICVECEREVPDGHVSNKIGPLKEERQQIVDDIEEITRLKESVSEKSTAAKAAIEAKTPKLSINEAKSIHGQYKTHTDNMARYQKEINDIENETNPHTDVLSGYYEDLNKLNKEKEQLNEEIDNSALLGSHYMFISKAYNDRTKIKSYIFDEHIPYINKRLRHYLEVLGLDIQIQLNNNLGVDSNLWGYEFESGGERKRTDVAFMLAMFDLHELIYGRQCNIIVLDEVDGRLDDDGINGLVNIIKNDISTKVESIMIISHKDSMKDMFHKQLLVRRVNRFSQLVDIR